MLLNPVAGQGGDKPRSYGEFYCGRPPKISIQYFLEITFNRCQNKCMNGNHRYRKHLRLESHDYSSNGFYFITICCRKFKPYFGEVIENEMIMNDYGRVADKQWQALPERYPQLQNHKHQIMPNHMHGILEIHNSLKTQINTISQIIGAYKSLTYKSCRELSDGVLDKIWQTNFYEHVIRDDRAFEKIYEYIETNPAQWDKDKYYMK